MSFDKQKLTALYASGQLSEVERKELFAAALEDQELFDVLAHEDAVRDALLLPGARERVLAELKPQPSRWFAWAGGLAVAAATALVFLVVRTQPHPLSAPVLQQQVSNTTAPVPIEIGRAEPEKSKQLAAAPSPIRNVPVAIQPDVASRQTAPLEAAEAAKSEVAKKEVVELKAKAEEVSVTAASGALRTEPAVVGALPLMSRAPATMPASAPTYPYSILRRDAGGVFVPLPKGEALKRGDAVRIAITSPVDGRMVVDTGSSSAIQDTKAGERYLIPTANEFILNNASGESVVRVSFQSSDRSGVTMPFKDASAGGAAAPAIPQFFEIKLTYK